MNIFVLSHRCGHCVHHQVVMGPDEYQALKARCVGRPCPVCGDRPRAEEDLQLVAPREHVDAAADGTGPWGNVLRPTADFAGFGSDGPGRQFTRGAFASSLRDKMYGQAASARKAEHEALSRAFTTLLAAQIGIDAHQHGEHAKAVLWLERAAPVAKTPSEVAAVRLHLGLSLIELGEPGRAEAALRGAIEQTGADPVFRSAAARQLGNVRKELGDLAGARAAFQLAIDLGIPEFAAEGAINLGMLEDEAGHQAEARRLWEFAYDKATDDRSRAFAAHNLGWYWEQAGDLTKSRRFYQLAAKSSVPEVATRAAQRLRVLPAPSRRFFGRRS